MSLIEVKNLNKTFKKAIRGKGVKDMLKTLFSHKYENIEAVKDVSFNIEQGGIVGYIGANGAGKSTTVKMMCGILCPTSGEVYVNGLDVYKNRKKVNKELGVVFGQKTQLWWDIPLIETFEILKSIYDISDEDYNERFEYLKKLLDLDEFLNQNVRSLSLGQRMRADFAASLIHNPKILFLDEPTIGLDVLVKSNIRKAIKELNKKYNTTVNAITTLNNLTSNTLSIGQTLKIPVSTQNTNEKTYTVKSGDTLYSIARKYNTTVSDLINRNNLKTSNLSIGQKLIIPNNN